MNKLIIMGRLCADPELRHTQSNKQIASFRLAVNRGGRQAEGEPTADFFNVQAWEKTAEFVSKYFKKGMQVLVEGVIRNNDYTDKNGVKHYAMQVTANQVFFAEGKRESTVPQDPPVGQDGVGGQGYYQQPDNAPEPWEQQAQQQRQAPPQNQQQAPQGQYQQDPRQYQQQYQQQQQQQQSPGFGPPAGQQPRQPWQT